MREYCHCGEPVFEEGEPRCAECEADYQRDKAHYFNLFRAGALTPPGPWKSRDDLIREAGERDD
jgi:hypothetical protein